MFEVKKTITKYLRWKRWDKHRKGEKNTEKGKNIIIRGKNGEKVISMIEGTVDVISSELSIKE